MPPRAPSTGGFFQSFGKGQLLFQDSTSATIYFGLKGLEVLEDLSLPTGLGAFVPLKTTIKVRPDILPLESPTQKALPNSAASQEAEAMRRNEGPVLQSLAIISEISPAPLTLSLQVAAQEVKAALEAHGELAEALETLTTT